MSKKRSRAKDRRLLMGRGCMGKIKHSSKEEGEEHIARLDDSFQDMSVYDCVYCGKIHVGHRYRQLVLN